MKKVIFLVAVLAMTLGCKDTKSDQKADVNNQVNDSIPAAIKAGCVDIIVIDLDKIPANDLQDWLDTNKDRYCTTQLTNVTSLCYNNKSCSSNIKIVDLDLVKDPANDTNENANNLERAKWLNENGHFICYPKTYPYLLEAHKITIEAMKTAMLKEDHFDIDFSDIIAQIEKQGGVDYFSDDEYKKWVILSVSKKNVVATLTGTFTTKLACVSIPFLRSIERTFCPDDDIKVEVYPFTYNGEDLMGLKIYSTTPGKPSYLFNYSNDPKRK